MEAQALVVVALPGTSLTWFRITSLTLRPLKGLPVPQFGVAAVVQNE